MPVVVPKRGACNLTLSIQIIQVRYITKIRHIQALFHTRPLLHFNLLIRTSQQPPKADNAHERMKRKTRRGRFIAPIAGSSALGGGFPYPDYFVNEYNPHLLMSGIFCDKSYAASTFKNMNGGRPQTCHVLLQELDLVLSVSS